MLCACAHSRCICKHAGRGAAQQCLTTYTAWQVQTPSIRLCRAARTPQALCSTQVRERAYACVCMLQDSPAPAPCVGECGVKVPTHAYTHTLAHAHPPGPVRPARPALCLPEAWLMGVTTRESIPFLGLNTCAHCSSSTLEAGGGEGTPALRCSSARRV